MKVEKKLRVDKVTHFSNLLKVLEECNKDLRKQLVGRFELEVERGKLVHQ